MTFADALRAATQNPGRPNLEELARAALAEQREDQALALLVPAAATMEDARLWQWTGLLHRALDEHGNALEAFCHAASLAPGDAGIAHGHARVALEAGIDSVALFERALTIATNPGGVLLGLGAARFSAGQGARALDQLAQLLDGNPGWIEGHRQFAQLASLTGEFERLTESIDRALARAPSAALLETKLGLLIGAEHYVGVLVAVRDEGHLMPPSSRILYEALGHSELSDIKAAEPLFQAIADDDATGRVWRVRHLLRSNRAAQAVGLIDRWLASDEAASAWPYASIAWRLTGDSRWFWLEGDPRLIETIDLGDRLPPLTDMLRSLHRGAGRFADQSVRAGSQTDGPLLSRVEPEIVALRKLLADAVGGYIKRLPPLDPRHPLLSRRRDREPRFAGSWSVRLGAAGHHANHVHPQGWISSALYIALPEEVERGAGPDAGWLSLGEPQANLGLDLPPIRLVEPLPGRLVLFPSTMWHGTRTFDRGERLTVAFDVAPPLP